MTQTKQLIDALKRILKVREISYAKVAAGIGISEASVKRLFSKRTFTLKKLEEICGFLEIDFFELAKVARGKAEFDEYLTEKAETELAQDTMLLGIFNLLRNDWQPADILAKFELSKADCLRYLARLDRMRLIDLLPGDRVKLRVPRTLRLRQDGPIRRILGPDAMRDFLLVRFEEHGGHFRFEVRELSQASLLVLQRKIDRLTAEFNELAELDSTLPYAERNSIGIALGIRPWEIGMITGLKERQPISVPIQYEAKVR